MQRASLTPITQTDFETPVYRWWQIWLPPLRRLPAWTWAIICITFRNAPRLVNRFIRGLLRALATDLAGGSGAARRIMPLRRMAAGAALHLLWLPLGLALGSVWLVRQATHPAGAGATAISGRLGGVYSERIQLTASDGTHLSAVWVPATTPHDVLAGREQALRERHPAVLLVHDHGEDARQMLPAAGTLHELGYHVLVLDTRGAGQSEPTARTFGQREALDVAAAIEYLRTRSTVDPQRIAGWGLGYGGLAVTGADVASPLQLAVMERPPSEGDERFVPAGFPYDLARPACRWTFALLHGGGLPPYPSARPLRTVEAAGMAEAFEAIEATFNPNLSLAALRE